MTTTKPATTIAAMAMNLVVTENPFNRVLTLVLMELARPITNNTRMESSLCERLPV